MDYKKKFKELHSYVKLLQTQLDEKRLNELSLKNASDHNANVYYHEARQEAFNEATIDVGKILKEIV